MMQLELYINNKLLDKMPTQKKKITQHQNQLKAKWKKQIKTTKNWFIAALAESKMNKRAFRLKYGL